MAKIGRNEPCPCRSGRKFKRCHGQSIRIGDDPVSADADTGYPFDPLASMLERVVRPHLISMRKAALIQWCEILDRWASEGAQHKDAFDTIRLERLQKTALGIAQDLLKAWDSRFSLQAVRSLPHCVVATICQIPASDIRQLAQVLDTLSAVAATAPGVRWPRIVSEELTAISLTDVQLLELELRIPEVLGRLIGACHLLVWSQIWYRWAGKGLRIASVPESFGRSAREAIDHWDGRGIFIVPAVELTKDESIEKAVTAYDERREKQKVGIARAGLLQPSSTGLTEKPHRLWCAVLRAPHSAALPVHVPKIDKTFPAPNWYPIPDTSWVSMVRFLGIYFDPQLDACFGLSALELELCLAAVGLVVERQTQCGWLTEGRWRGKQALVLDSPANALRLEDAVSHLVSVLLRGTIRVSGATFRNALALELQYLGATDSTMLAERFFDAFRGIPTPVGFTKPFLFWERDEQTCLHDLTTVTEFLDGVLSIVTGGDGPVANVRSSVFEDQARKYLEENLSLTSDRIPWKPNKDVWVRNENFGDVDFCFSVGNTLVNLDMKSWQRNSDYSVGHYHTIQARCRDLVKQLQRAEQRGNALLAKLNAESTRYQECVSFLVVAAPEYLDPSKPSLWYGAPPKEPRVVTVEELRDLVSNRRRLNQLLGGNRNQSPVI
jgi:SEC-C motif